MLVWQNGRAGCAVAWTALRESPTTQPRIASRAAAWQVTQILAGNRALRQALRKMRLAYKTGTSYGTAMPGHWV